jgi:hypothetical protein
MVIVVVIRRGNTNAAPDPKKMNTFERGMLGHLQGVTADAIARGEEPRWDALYAPPDMHQLFVLGTAIRFP